MLMPGSHRAKSKKHKTRNHSNLRPKQRHSRDFLKVYYPYLPLAVITLMILSIVQPWQALLQRSQDVLPYATQMSLEGLIEETNERRTASQQSPLQHNEQLSKAAQIKAQDMVERNYWSHNTPDGNAPWEFINNAGYSYKKAGENLAYGFTDEDGVIAGWMNSPSHRANMLDGGYQEVGFGFANAADYLGKGPSTIVVAMYGQPSSAADTVVTSVAEPTVVRGAYNTLGLAGEPEDTAISRMQAWLHLPMWVNYVAAAFAGGLIVYLILKHSRSLKRAFAKGERFVLHHPLLDITLVAVVVLVALVSQQTGIIR